MVGPELTVVGWFATSIISNIINKACSVLGSNHALQTETENRLTDLENNSLPLFIATIEEASKSPIKNRGLIKWMDNLRNEAYKIMDALDDLEAKRFRESLKGKNKFAKLRKSAGKYLKTLILSDKELKAFIYMVDEFCRIFKGLPEFVNLLHEHRINANTEHNNTNRWETSSYLDPDVEIFGRDTEICFILDIISNCQLCFDQEKRNSNSSFVERITKIFGIARYWKGEFSEVRAEGKGEENIDMKSSAKGEENIDMKSSAKGEEKSNMKSSAKGKENFFGLTRYLKGGPQKKTRYLKGEGEQNSVSIRNWELPVLSICGIGGVGKTTIAKTVYNNKKVVEDFNLRVWVYVPEKFNVNIIMKNIIDSVPSTRSSSTHNNNNSDSITKQQIMSELMDKIRNKRLFLVLDDVPGGTESILLSDDLFPVIQHSAAPGSFVLVTTQSERVAKTIGNMPYIISLDMLEPKWFDLLFKYFAFGKLFSFDRKSGSSSISCENNAAEAQFNNLTQDKLSDLVSIATEIAEKLHGLPLAGQVIGKMLSTKLSDKGYWEKALKYRWWQLDEEISEKILTPLKIGYEDLDPDLQQCFKFCSIFPKHYEFDRNTLAQMWMAHGNDFIKPILQERLEDVGVEKFDKLVEGSFFQATVNEGKYVMHDLIREIAIAVSSIQEFYHLESLDNKVPLVTHHMGINCDGSNIEEINPIYTNLRTVILFGNWKNFNGQSISNVFAKSKGLRLLDLSNGGMTKNIYLTKKKFFFIERDIPILTANICQQSHLRFVDLSFSGIDYIPIKLCELFHLQVLDVRGCALTKLPRGMNKLVNLRHLYASAEMVSQISGIGKLTNLQELELFRIGFSKGHMISELMNMNEIRGHLRLTRVHNVTSKEEAATCQLAKKKYLKSLELTFHHEEKYNTAFELEPEVLEPLKPPPNVEILTISGGYVENLPGWMWSTQSELSNLKCINVNRFALTTLPAFGELPYLEVLSFHELPRLEMVGLKFYGHSDVVFPSLKELRFSCMGRWRTWSDGPAEKELFPRLKKITLESCRELIKMPTNIFTSSMVVELKLSDCNKINNIETILQCMPHLTHLSITDCCNDLSIYCTALRFLEVLCLGDVKHLCFVGGLKSLVNLRKLDIAGFAEILESFKEDEENDGTCQQNRFLTSLNLDCNDCSQLPFAGGLGYLRSLVIMKFFVREKESWFTQLTSLETLEFYSCWMTDLPSTIPWLTKLKKLTIESCPMISSLPESRLPPNLTELYITDSSHELVRRCQPEPDQGDDWWKISHIPHIQIKRSKR